MPQITIDAAQSFMEAKHYAATVSEVDGCRLISDDHLELIFSHQADLPDVFMNKSFGIRQETPRILGYQRNTGQQDQLFYYGNSLTGTQIDLRRDARWSGTIKNCALFVLLIACINFMNLATARAANRTREVGLRKVVGASRSQLIAQFLGESVFISFPALLLALILVQLLLPSLATVTGKDLSIITLLQMRPELLLALIILTFFVGLIAGSYPALYLSRFNPIDILKGMLSGDRGGRARKILVIC